MKNNKYKFMQDRHGNRSSKRLWGSLLLSIGTGLSFILFYYCLGEPDGTYGTAKDIINSFLFTGAGLLGITLGEYLINNDNNKKS